MGLYTLGRIVVAIYGGGSMVTTPGYHLYEMRSIPRTNQVAVYIDNIFWKNYSGTAVHNLGTNMVYWGDNNHQTSSIAYRETCFANAQWLAMPEPSRGGLAIGACVGVFMMNRRRSR